MKTPLTQIFIMFLLIIGTVSSSNSANAQCIAPNLKFLSPVLISGTSLSVGAKYKFSNVTPGVDCIVTIVKFNNGAKLITIKNTVDGYPDAWQPTIDGTTGPTGIIGSTGNSTGSTGNTGHRRLRRRVRRKTRR